MEWLTALAARIDWTHPELAPQAEALRAASPRDQLLAVVACLRRPQPDFFGFSADYLLALRRTATPAALAAAQAKLDAALQSDIYFPPHNNAFSALGDETLWLALDAPRAAALAERIAARHADWGRNLWGFGICYGAANLLRCLAPNPAVADEHLLPVLGWLTAIAETEWTSAARWGERVLGTGGHNWWVHSYYGFYMAGAFAPQFRGLAQYRALAPTYLEREAKLLFAEDGWSREGAFGYHNFAATNLFAFTRLAQRHGVLFSPGYLDHLRRIGDASWRLYAPDGDGTLFGDAAPAGPQVAERRPSHSLEPDCCTHLRRLAARFGLSEAKAAADLLAGAAAQPPAFLPDCGDDLAPVLARLRPQPPPPDTALPASGLYAFRTSWQPDADWLAINACPIGTIGSSHMHADIFNVEMCVRGRRVLVDNWYGDVTANDGSYQSIPEIRNNPMKRRWRVGSTAHNVATVDQQDHVPVRQVYRYGWSERPAVEAAIGDAQFAWFSGVSESYRHLAQPVCAHRRYIFWLRGEYLLILDRFTVEAEAPRTFQQHFFLLEGQALPGGQFRTGGAGGNLLAVPLPGLFATATLEPNPHPITSYQNPAHLQLETASKGDVLLGTLLVPFVDDAVPTASAELVPVVCHGRELTPWEATGVRLRVGERDDLFVKLHGHWNLPWQCGPAAGSARLYHSALGELNELRFA